MSYYAELDNKAKSGGDVASNNGWSMFAAWVEELDGELPQLRHLCEYGWCQNLPTLENDLKAALDSDPDESSKSIAEGLLKMLKSKADAEVIAITDGCGVQEEASP